MPTVKCPDCGGQVSTRAEVCPHCGRPIAALPGGRRVRTAEDSFLTRSRGCGDLVLYGAAILLLLFLLAGGHC